MTDAPECRYCGGDTHYRFPTRSHRAYECDDCGELTTVAV